MKGASMGAQDMVLGQGLTLDAGELDTLIAWCGSLCHPSPTTLSGLGEGGWHGHFNGV